MDMDRQHAVAILLGSAAPEPHDEVPKFLGPRAARRQAITTLATGEADALELAALVRAATAEADAHVRREAVLALANPGRAAVGVPVLIACSADPHPEVRAAARQSLTRLQPELATGLPPEPPPPTVEPRYELEEVRADTAIPL